jgi:hypothetical protein
MRNFHWLGVRQVPKDMDAKDSYGFGPKEFLPFSITVAAGERCSQDKLYRIAGDWERQSNNPGPAPFS